LKKKVQRKFDHEEFHHYEPDKKYQIQEWFPFLLQSDLDLFYFILFIF